MNVRSCFCPGYHTISTTKLMSHSSNFSFLQTEWPDLWQASQEAEQYCLSVPRHTANLCRIALENAIHWMYNHDQDLSIPYDKSLFSLMTEASFRQDVPPAIQDKLHALRKTANLADHQIRQVSHPDALLCLRCLHSFLRYFARCYSQHDMAPQAFDETLLPPAQQPDQGAAELDRVKAELAAKVQEIDRLTILRSEDEAKIALVRQQEKAIHERKQENAHRPPLPTDPNEAQTRQLYLDVLLKEVGWDPEAPRVREYPVQGMPIATNPSGQGQADYVLWGDDGRPLAVVEAKRTLTNPQLGQRQAELYADALEQMHGQRPIIFYSNGYDTYLWDDQRYPPRRVHGFYTRDELQTLVNRRSARQDLTQVVPRPAIAGRFYQQEAIKRVAETFQQAHRRHALLVMATGTGKTRVAASLSELLLRAQWAKRILFLADRNALVTQAKTKFGEFLVNVPMVDVTQDKESAHARIVFSTYPTMMNLIDGKNDADERVYSVGHFDLIIVDEAHRSVYNKYGAIFDYFDAPMIGLTATPKDDIEHNTYELFEVTDGNPTFAYELDQAIRDDVLVPPRALGVPIKFPRQGIKYDELSEAEQTKYEETFRDEATGFLPDEVDKKALYEWLFNVDTVDKVLTYLMEHGLRVAGGDRLGKTIIFAKNHAHAVLIQERFEALYPEHCGKFLRIIDYQDTKAASTLADFSEKEKMPHIAVSVDMLDTGIDIPELLNLVFFKRVYSSAKYWQMIGRGTRQCADLLGPGQDKEAFYIFDFCENFEFFDEKPDGVEPTVSESLSQRIFKTKLAIAELLKTADEPLSALRQQYLDTLHQQVIALNRDNFTVRRQLRYLDQFAPRERWDDLSSDDVATINRELAHLPVITDHDEAAKRFDALLYRLQWAILSDTPERANLTHRVVTIADALAQKMNIPVIKRQQELIDQVTTDTYWNGVRVDQLEELRSRWRGLVRFLTGQKGRIVYANLQDEIVGEAQEHDIIRMSTQLQSYRLRVERYLREHADTIAIQRVRKGETLTRAELESLEALLFREGALGTHEEFQREYGQDKPLTYFIRSILGFDTGAAKQAFGEFLNNGNLQADQITFINNIIDSLEKNGVIDKGMLFDPPFTHIHDEGAYGLFEEEEATRIFSIVDRLNAGIA